MKETEGERETARALDEARQQFSLQPFTSTTSFCLLPQVAAAGSRAQSTAQALQDRDTSPEIPCGPGEVCVYTYHLLTSIHTHTHTHTLFDLQLCGEKIEWLWQVVGTE